MTKDSLKFVGTAVSVSLVVSFVCAVFTVVFACLKLIGLFDFRWIAVIAPMSFPVAFIVVLLIARIIVSILARFLTKHDGE